MDYLLSPNTTFKSTPMAGTPSLSLGINLKVSKFQRFQSSVNFAIFYSVMCILNNAMLHRQVFSLIIRLCYMIFFFYSAFSASHWSTFSLTSATNLSWSVSMAIVLFCRFVHCRGRVSCAIPIFQFAKIHTFFHVTKKYFPPPFSINRRRACASRRWPR